MINFMYLRINLTLVVYIQYKELDLYSLNVVFIVIYSILHLWCPPRLNSQPTSVLHIQNLLLFGLT